jgi:hypothetical protein
LLLAEIDPDAELAVDDLFLLLLSVLSFSTSFLLCLLVLAWLTFGYVVLFLMKNTMNCEEQLLLFVVLVMYCRWMGMMCLGSAFYCMF